MPLGTGYATPRRKKKAVTPFDSMAGGSTFSKPTNLAAKALGNQAGVPRPGAMTPEQVQQRRQSLVGPGVAPTAANRAAAMTDEHLAPFGGRTPIISQDGLGEFKRAAYDDRQEAIRAQRLANHQKRQEARSRTAFGGGAMDMLASRALQGDRAAAAMWDRMMQQQASQQAMGFTAQQSQFERDSRMALAQQQQEAVAAESALDRGLDRERIKTGLKVAKKERRGKRKESQAQRDLQEKLAGQEDATRRHVADQRLAEAEAGRQASAAEALAERTFRRPLIEQQIAESQASQALSEEKLKLAQNPLTAYDAAGGREATGMSPEDFIQERAAALGNFRASPGIPVGSNGNVMATRFLGGLVTQREKDDLDELAAEGDTDVILQYAEQMDWSEEKTNKVLNRLLGGSYRSTSDPSGWLNWIMGRRPHKKTGAMSDQFQSAARRFIPPHIRLPFDAMISN